ncbi:unnamed protein product [Adineta steineri]|uniref:DUF6570 domain-containing protein n=1 Tax=Adineta steineri TaxID=433720 RepID=A0A815UJM9_9BILA|nr:unnamed protein product [Adineta steineri]
MPQNIDIEQHDTEIQRNDTEISTPTVSRDMRTQAQGQNLEKNKKHQTRSRWPEPIPGHVKNHCLNEFIQSMSMSMLAENTCAICNSRNSLQTSKKLLISQIPNIHLLKVSDDIKNLIINTSSLQMTESIQSNLNSDSSSFYYEHDTVLYKNGLFQQNKKNMCTMCEKCHTALSKGVIPKFSVANNMWLGDVPVELQGLTIPEEKLISLHRHNSCIIKLQSPFHSMATAQGALKGKCITFLQNTPNIVNSLPLKMADLCDTLNVIFIGARPPERIQLKRILTVRKKKIVEALRWLKKYNILYKNIDINLDNTTQLPENDIPESIMTTMEQILNDKEVPSERAGYIPDPLSNSIELNISDVIPVNNS